MTRAVVFTEHAAWRAGERGHGHVHLEVLAEEIAAALRGGWYSRVGRELHVTTRSSQTFVVCLLDNEAVVLTALNGGMR